MNYLREYYERALQEFGTSDEGELDWNVQKYLEFQGKLKVWTNFSVPGPALK